MKYSELLELDKAKPKETRKARSLDHQGRSDGRKRARGTSVSPGSEQRRHPATVIPRDHDTRASTIEVIRKAVKEIGKEAATHRFTKGEKDQIAEIVYAYNRRGARTSENEIARIAINSLVQDYKENGENSVLNRVMKALRE
jgi:hypothetical protein